MLFSAKSVFAFSVTTKNEAFLYNGKVRKKILEHEVST